MRFALLLALLFAATQALAQQPPATPGIQQKPARPPLAPAPPMPDKLMQAPGAATLSSEELLELLQAQTAAIKALNEKVGELEQRIERIELGVP